MAVTDLPQKMKFLILTALAITLFILFPAVSYAESCTYCGNYYPEAAPGDESRVYALRRDHEASCSSRPMADPGSGHPSSGGGMTAAEAVLKAETERKTQEHREKVAREYNRKAQAEIARKEEKRLDVKRRQAEWETKKKGLLSSLKSAGANPPPDFTWERAPEDLKNKPTVEGSEDPNDPKQVHSSQVGSRGDMTAVTGADPVQFENLRRSLWLHKKAEESYRRNDMEDYHYLSEQAAQAMSGQTLQVEVPPAENMPEINNEKVKAFADMAVETEKKRIVAEKIEVEKLTLDDRKAVLQNEYNALMREAQAIEADPLPAASDRSGGQSSPVASIEEGSAPGEGTSSGAVPSSAAAKDTKSTSPVAVMDKADDNKKEGLLAKMLAIKEKMAQTNKALDALAKDQEKARAEFKDSESKLRGFAGGV